MVYATAECMESSNHMGNALSYFPFHCPAASPGPMVVGPDGETARLGEETGKRKQKGENKAVVENTHTLVFPRTTYRCENRTVKKADREKLTHLEYGVGGEHYGYPGPPER